MKETTYRWDKHGVEHVTEEVATYTLVLHGPRGGILHSPFIKPALLRETEENLTDLLPAGYRVEIKEWDSDE